MVRFADYPNISFSADVFSINKTIKTGERKMDIDLNDLSVESLKTQKEKIERAIEEKENEGAYELRQEVDSKGAVLFINYFFYNSRPPAHSFKGRIKRYIAYISFNTDRSPLNGRCHFINSDDRRANYREWCDHGCKVADRQSSVVEGILWKLDSNAGIKAQPSHDPLSTIYNFKWDSTYEVPDYIPLDRYEHNHKPARY